MGEYAKAEPLFQEALRINRKVLGPEHPNTAASLGDLAVLYHDMGAYAKAEPLYQEALRINQKVLGPEHSNTATSLNNLAALYKESAKKSGVRCPRPSAVLRVEYLSRLID